MKVDMNRHGGWSVIKIEGRMDTISAPDFEKQAQDWIGQGEHRMVVDLSDLEYISSAGLRALLVAAKAAKASGGQLRCCSLKGVVKKVFDVSGFSSMLPVYESLDAALSRQ